MRVLVLSNNELKEQVTREFVEQYVREVVTDFKSVDEFLDEYTADNTLGFYQYAMEYGAVIAVENE